MLTQAVSGFDRYCSITIICKLCGQSQELCATGMPLSGLCTNCRKKQWRKRHPEPKLPKCFCKNCKTEIGKNSRTGLCRDCRRKSQKDRISAYSRVYNRNRYHKDPLFMLSKQLRSRLSCALRELRIEKQGISAVEHLGCTIPELKSYFESKFLPGMTWANYGKWHIDHIIPLSLATTREDLYQLVRYTNLQPLWAHDNLRKSNKLLS